MFKMSAKEIPVVLKSVFGYIENNRQNFINTLKAAVAIPSVSAFPEKRSDVVSMIHWTADKMKSLGIECEICDIGVQHFPSGEAKALPPVILGSLGKDPKKRTVCLYGHLDVQPASIQDGWNTEPFELTEVNGKLYGRGSSDDKGPAISWLHAIEAFQKTNSDLPVNIKFCFEGMEESGSEGLDRLLVARKETFFKDVDYVCISDSYWLGTKKPCLAYGLRGLCYFAAEVTCAAKDLHSGIYGGSVHEALADLIAVLSGLLDKNGKILIPGIMDDVVEVTEEERTRYKDIDFDVHEYRNEIGARKLHHDLKEDVLMSRWRFPSLSIHGIEGAFSEPGSKTVVPKKVIGKFSIRIVPNQEPSKVEALVISYLTEQWNQRSSPNHFKAYMMDSGRPWLSDVNHSNYLAARIATKLVYGVDPDLIREGGSIPITLTLQELTGTNVLLLPMGASDDGAHSQNEKIDVRNYIEGTKLMAAYLYELARIEASDKKV